MDSPTCNIPISASNHSTTTTNSNLATRAFKNDHSNTQLLISAGKEVEHGSQVSDQQVESSSPATAQPNSVNAYSTMPIEVDAQNNSIFYETSVTNTSSIVNNSNTTTDDTSNKKPTPKRAMILLGRPAPPLPPRPVFPADLKNYQLQSGTAETSSHMQAYLARVRHDFEQQTEHFEVLKEILLEDTHHMTAVVDELDAMDEDPFTLDSFENLMRMHASKGKDFIIARVTTQDPNDGEKHYHSYYGAHQINKVLFRTQPDEGLLHRMKARNVRLSFLLSFFCTIVVEALIYPRSNSNSPKTSSTFYNASQPLNNMLVVGDVHYYIISAADIKAVRPLPAVIRSSSASISSHSSRMSRCSKLAAQAIASQSASARSSPILGSDMSLFSRSSDLESPVSIISPLMALSILKADQEDPLHRDNSDGGSSSSTTPATTTADQDVQPLKPRRRGSQGTTSSTTLTPTFPQGAATFHHQPGRPSRLRQAIETEDICDSPITMMPTAGAGSFAEDTFSPMTPPAHQACASSSQASPSSAAGQSPLFQSLMGGRVRGRSSTVSSVSSDKSSTSTMSARSHASKCSTATNESNCSVTSNSKECYSPSVLDSPNNNSNFNATQDNDNVVYKFRYLASDDDFLLRSTVRQTFKVNALETWDAILFTISNNALREYSNQGGEQVLQPLGGHGHHHPFSLPPSSLPSATSGPVPFEQPDQQVPSSSPTPITAAGAVAAQYSAAHNQSQNQGTTSLPPLILPRHQDVPPSSRTTTELHHHHSDTTSAPNNNTTSFDTEDTPSSPLHRGIRRSGGGGLYSAGVNGGPRTFNIQSFSHTPRRQSHGGQEIQQLEGEGGVEGLGRSMSQSCHSRRMDLFRSLPVLPLGASGIGAGQEGSDGEASELDCGASSTTGSRKKLRRVLSKIFSRK